jgi:hypothetical protein
VDAFFTHANDAPEDKTGSLPVLASALCQSHAYPQAIAKLQSGLQMANETYGPEKLPAGLSAFLTSDMRIGRTAIQPLLASSWNGEQKSWAKSGGPNNHNLPQSGRLLYCTVMGIVCRQLAAAYPWTSTVSARCHPLSNGQF